MSKRIVYLLSLTLVLGMVSDSYGVEVVVGDFESDLDGWFERDATISLSATGATVGVQAMQVEGPGDWHINALLDLKPHREALSNIGVKIMADVTAFDADLATTWMNIEMIINAQNNDDAGPNNNIGWQSLGSQPVVRDGQPNTYTWEVPEALATAISGVDDNIWWFELALVTNLDAASPTKFYIDNIRIVYEEATSSILLGDFESDLDGWFERDATISQSATGATLGAQAMQVEGPGDWHINALLDLKPHREGLSNIGAKITADVTAFDADLATTWMNIEMIINAQNNDDAGPNNNIGWQSLGSQPVTRDGEPHTYTWEIPDALATAISGVDDNIWWFELALVTNLDAASPTKFYIDNIQLIIPLATVDPPKSTDLVIGDWEQDLDQWVAGASTDVLYSNQNGVTLGDYSLDVFLQNGGGWQDDVLRLNLLEAGLLDAFKANSVVTMDITRLVADWPTDKTPGWNEIALILNTGGDGWSLWQNMGVRANWYPSDGDETETVTWDYSQYFSQINYLEGATWLELWIVSNVDGNYDGTTWFYLDNMKLIGAGVPLDQTPANGTGDVSTDTALLWTPRDVVTSHHVYFGTDQSKVERAVMDSDPDVTFMELDDAYFDPNGLEFGTQYFWRIDEVNEDNPDSPWRGPVWSFSTAIFGVVDDFESYNALNPDVTGSNRLFEVWLDGFGDDTNGALAGHDYLPYTEAAIVNSGGQSMPVYYDNTGAALKSEVQRAWAEPQDWTIERFNILKLFTHGLAQNVPGELYVIIEDSTGNSYTASNPESTIFTVEEWKAWDISLDGVAAAGVDLTAVTKLVIGVADLAGQEKAAGLIYVDDIRIQRALSSDNILTNGGFEEGPTMVLNTWDPLSWSVYDNTSAPTFEVVSELTGAAVSEPLIEGQYSLHVVTSQGVNFWDAAAVNLIDYDVNIGVHYTVSLFMKSKQGTADVNIKFEHTPGPPWTGYAEQMVTVTEEWQEFSVTSQPFTSKVKARIVLHTAAQDTDIWVDNVRFYEGDYVAPPSN